MTPAQLCSYPGKSTCSSGRGQSSANWMTTAGESSEYHGYHHNNKMHVFGQALESSKPTFMDLFDPYQKHSRWGDDCPHLTDPKTEAQKGKPDSILPLSHNPQVERPKFKTGSSNCKPLASFHLHLQPWPWLSIYWARTMCLAMGLQSAEAATRAQGLTFQANYSA